MKKLVGFNEALEALKMGKCIKRESSLSRHVSRKIEMLGKTEIEYGTIDYQHKYYKGGKFDYEDVFANDWNIEEK